MHLLLEKRHVVLAALVVMLGLAVFVNWYYSGTKTELSPEGTAAASESAETPDGAAKFTSGTEDGAESADAADAFAAMRMNRAAARSEAVEQLQAAAANASAGSEEALSAAAAIDALTAASAKEADIESLVSSAVGGECLAVVSENAVDVIVGAEDLNDGNVLRINEIVRDICGGACENIRISAAR